jgi:hypothetical protein
MAEFTFGPPWPRCICCGTLRKPELMDKAAVCKDTKWCVEKQLRDQGATVIPDLEKLLREEGKL